MTEQEERLTAGIDYIVGYEIVKRIDMEELPVVNRYFVVKVADLADPEAFVQRLILEDRMPDNSGSNPGQGVPPFSPSSSMSIRILEGNNLYLMRFANDKDGHDLDTQTKWGPGISPVSFLPDNIHGGNAIKKVQLLCNDDGKVKAIPAASMPTKLDEVPDVAWLSFRCDITDMRKLWKVIGFDSKKKFAFPIRYNLFDSERKTPVWALDYVDHDDHHERGHDHEDHRGHHSGGSGKSMHAGAGEYAELAEGVRPLLQIMGIPTEEISRDIVVFQMTHGGIHPSMMIYQFAVEVMKNSEAQFKKMPRTHGGIHPNSMVDYFYEGP